MTGYAHLVTDTLELAWYQAQLCPGLRRPMDHAVRIHPDLATGLLRAEAARAIAYTRRTWTALGRAVRELGLHTIYEPADIWRCSNSYDQKREDAECPSHCMQT